MYYSSIFSWKIRFSDAGAKHLATFLDSPQAKGRIEALHLGLNLIKDEGCGLLANVIFKILNF